LGSAKDPELLKKVIDFAMSKEVRAQDAVFVISSVASNPKGRDLAWEFFKSNWKILFDKYEGGFLLSRLVKYVTDGFASNEKADEIEKFFQTNNFPGTERTVQQSIETIKLNAAWLQRDLAKLTEFFNKY
jgi:puromycin-sensitive aminopeptidase